MSNAVKLKEVVEPTNMFFAPETDPISTPEAI